MASSKLSYEKDKLSENGKMLANSYSTSYMIILHVAIFMYIVAIIASNSQMLLRTLSIVDYNDYFNLLHRFKGSL